ncbi:GatB/YqeY domain-containing protein [Akkermansiaceae bacterium]|nr:GatB/YqeY domain-containing protein [Akkermansiaceae bacterium]MDA8980626.1 GatB/YqeY domain-containing protein [bacterium]MDA7863513.1 GatB/YqeY domain-containing protein [Akkermansiaceae bacterium]MDB0056222.1 GatB/YqeY domain-containing protein [Akkermansiaceae bacterium]MDB4262077.1 GatB/YqeY domain-containing protein [Akkermansiaceae bacterium]
MSNFSTQLMSDIKDAMKAKDTVALTTLRALKTAITTAKTQTGGVGIDNELPETENLALVRKQIKQRQDSIEQFEKADRQELADNEKAEIVVLGKYLPAALGAEEISTIVAGAVAETGASSRADMGKVMKIVQEKIAGRADGKTLSAEVMKHLS